MKGFFVKFLRVTKKPLAMFIPYMLVSLHSGKGIAGDESCGSNLFLNQSAEDYHTGERHTKVDPRPDPKV